MIAGLGAACGLVTRNLDTDSAGLPGGPAHQELLPGHRGQGQHEAGAGRGVLALPGPPVSAQHPQHQDVCNL